MKLKQGRTSSELSVCLCLAVCLFVSNKRQKDWTDQVQIFAETCKFGTQKNEKFRNWQW